MIVVAAVILTAGLLGSVWLWRSGSDRVVRSRARQMVVVTLKGGATFRGVLFEADDRSLVLRNAGALDGMGSDVMPVDGELLLARAEIGYVQRP